MFKITSNKNPLIKEIKSLYRKKERMKSHSFIIEGIKIMEEVLDYNYQIKTIIYSEQLLNIKDGVDLYERISGFDNLVYVSDRIFNEISDTEKPQGIMAIVEFQYKTTSEIRKEDKVSLLYLDGLQDPGNMGTIIRTADAFNIDGIIITPGSVDPYNPKVVRATMGSIFRVALYYAGDEVDELINLKSQGINIYSTSLDKSVPIDQANFVDSFILIIGNESKGVSKDLLSLSDKLIKIPMPGKAESLNAGVAASVIMYEVMKQRV